MVSELFRIELIEHSLVVTFDRPCNMMSWSPLHGGLRSGVSHFLVRQFNSDETAVNEERLLRQVAGRLRLKGTVVGAGTTADLESRGTSTTSDGDLRAAVLALLPNHKRIPESRNEPSRASKDFHSPPLLVVLNKCLTHEAMFETMALAVDLRRRFWLRQAQDAESPPAAAHVDWVVISTLDEVRYRGDFRPLSALTSKALMQSLKAI